MLLKAMPALRNCLNSFHFVSPFLKNKLNSKSAQTRESSELRAHHFFLLESRAGELVLSYLSAFCISIITYIFHSCQGEFFVERRNITKGQFTMNCPFLFTLRFPPHVSRFRSPKDQSPLRDRSDRASRVRRKSP